MFYEMAFFCFRTVTSPLLQNANMRSILLWWIRGKPAQIHGINYFLLLDHAHRILSYHLIKFAC